MNISDFNSNSSTRTVQDSLFYLNPRSLIKEQKKTHDLFLKGLVNSPIDIQPGPNNTVIEDFPFYLNPRSLTKEQKKTHDLFLKGLVNSPLDIQPGPNNSAIAQVPYQFLREHKIYQKASYAIGPHPYLIKRFINTDIGDCKHLEIKPESAVRYHPGEENVQRQSKYSHKKRFCGYKVKSLSIPEFTNRHARFEVSLTTANKTQIKPFDFLFVPESAQIPAQFSSLENFSQDKSKSFINFSFSMNLDSGKSDMMPWNSAFFLVSRERKQYAPFEVSLEQEFLPKLLSIQMDRLYRSSRMPPANVLLWGSNGSGKTSFCAGVINTVGEKCNTASPLDFSLISEEVPNPIMRYPSKIFNLFDVGSGTVKDYAGLSKIVSFLDQREDRPDVVCLFLDINEIGDSAKVANALTFFDYSMEISRVAILILTKIDQYESKLESGFHSSVKLEKVLFGLKAYGFPIVVPMINYRKDKDKTLNDLTSQAVMKVLCDARFLRLKKNVISQ